MHGAILSPPAFLAAVTVFHALEIGLHMAEAPALGAHFLPGVEILGVPPDIDHAVD